MDRALSGEVADSAGVPGGQVVTDQTVMGSALYFPVWPAVWSLVSGCGTCDWRGWSSVACVVSTMWIYHGTTAIVDSFMCPWVVVVIFCGDAVRAMQR